MEQRGIEPLTSALRTRRSAKLSYCPTHRRIQFQVSGFKFRKRPQIAQITEQINAHQVTAWRLAKPRALVYRRESP